MIAALLLLATLGGGLSCRGWAEGALPCAVTQMFAGATCAPVSVTALSGWVGPGLDSSQVLTDHVYLPFVARVSAGCEPIPGAAYGSLDVNGPPTDPPAEKNPDLNLSMRGYEVTDAYHGLVDYGGGGDPKAPQLYTVFADQRVPAFPTVSKVYDWDWECNCRGDLLTGWEVTLAGLGVAPGEVLALPDSGYDIGDGYEALVLYASETRITLKYTREDNVVFGYTIHVENACVEPSLLALYRAWNDAGRGELPALRGGEPFGRARGGEIGVAIRDSGSFMDPRSRKDWWQVR